MLSVSLTPHVHSCQYMLVYLIQYSLAHILTLYVIDAFLSSWFYSWDYVLSSYSILTVTAHVNTKHIHYVQYTYVHPHYVLSILCFVIIFYTHIYYYSNSIYICCLHVAYLCTLICTMTIHTCICITLYMCTKHILYSFTCVSSAAQPILIVLVYVLLSLVHTSIILDRQLMITTYVYRIHIAHALVQHTTH